ncbi:MAG: glycosyltransferase family 4 protein [Flavobacteriales bacterium]
MKILQLCLKPPLPARDGGCIAMNNITRGLLEAGHKVKILTIFTQKHDFDPDALPEEYIESTGIEGVFIDTRLNAVDAFANIITSDSYNISRFFSTDYDIKLTKLLQKEDFDIIHLESLFMTPYLGTIRRLSSTPVVLRSHNLEFVIWEKIARGTRNVAKRAYLSYLSKKLRAYELSMLNEVSGIAAISEEDKKRFLALGVKKRIRTIPFGFELQDYPYHENLEPELALFHLGAMDWEPNLEGILWFLQDIWPAILRKYNTMKLYIAGRNMPEDVQHANYPGVVMCGEVESAVQFMESKAIMIVPLLSAGGIRVKIIEGLALGKAVISTTLGAEGLDCTDGTNIMLADRKEDWLHAVDQLIDNDVRKAMGRAGREHALAHFNNDAVTQTLISFYKELCNP